MHILIVQKLYVNTNTINMSIYKGIQNWIYQFIIQRSCKEIVETTLLKKNITLCGPSCAFLHFIHQ